MSTVPLDDTVRFPPVGVPVVELRGAGKTYPGPPEVVALRGADLVIERGDYVAVTGPSGSGKSTWLNIVGLLDTPSTGQYLIDGVDAGSLSEKARTGLRAERIGFVFQSFHLLPHRTAVENVMLGSLYLGKRRIDRQRAAVAVLERVGLSHRAGALAGELSGGERQRVAIARALVAEPSLLLCDEPTGNLDSASAARVLDLVEEVHRSGQTVVVVTHDVEVAARARRRVTIHDGLLGESG
ncbi:ABC transporter ATP-binding protein [Actinokineospora globicatena]|uniref:ABC transporter ATP-binding protein n=1 Tax=Actinokineospora globicatena TaxID=103729 RepID=UPI0025569218|nr:ABC transporter ATP-binding protein [Actinokineospora globicatena]